MIVDILVSSVLCLNNTAIIQSNKIHVELKWHSPDIFIYNTH